MSRKRKPFGTILGLLVLPLIFLVVGLVFLVASFGHFSRARESAIWPMATATIETSELIVPGRGSKTFRVVYGHTISGRPYRSNRVAYGSYNSAQAKRWTASYPVGTQVTAPYNPANPKEAVLEPRVASGGWVLPIFGLLLFGVGVGLGLFFLREGS